MDIETVLQQGIEAANAAEDLRSLDDVRVNYLGKKGGLTGLLKSLGKLDPAERPKPEPKSMRPRWRCSGILLCERMPWKRLPWPPHWLRKRST